MNEYLKVYKLYNKSLFNYKDHSLFESVYRILAIIIYPMVKFINPNFISFLSLFLSFIAIYIYSSFSDLKLNILIIFFIISFILDFSDGMVARIKKKSSFNGRFIDGLFDIIVIGVLHIIFLNELLKNNSNNFNLNFYLISILILPIQHLILDRYSALARWINEIKNLKIIPYYKNNFDTVTRKILYDLQHLCLWLLFFNLLNNLILIELFFLFSVIASTFSIIIYFSLSKTNFSSTENQKDNDE